MLLLILTCKDKPKTTDNPKLVFELSSSNFANGAAIPDSCSCKASSVQSSPQLQWKNAPSGTASFALIADDPDAIPVAGYTWDHWILYNIPATNSSLASGHQNAMKYPAGTRAGKTSFGDTLYGGPCPPTGQTHTYHFRLFALNKSLSFSMAPTSAQLRNAMKGNVLDSAVLKGTFTQ